MTTAAVVREPAVRPPVQHCNPDPVDRLSQDVRDEFHAMPGLNLTLPQAARLFDIDVRRAKRVLIALLDEGFLLRDARGIYHRRDASSGGRTASAGRSRVPAPAVNRQPARDRTRTAIPARPEPDVLEAIGVELPRLGSHESYRVSLRSIRLSQMTMEAGCQVRHFADCPPAGFANIVDAALLAELERVVERIELAADGAGGRLVSLL